MYIHLVYKYIFIIFLYMSNTDRIEQLTNLVNSLQSQIDQINSGNIDNEVRNFINDLIKEKEQFIKEKGMGAVGALMGPVMSEFRGKMDGGDINKILMKKIKEIL